MFNPNIANAKKEIDYDCEVNKSRNFDKLSAARLRLMREQPFYSTIAIRLNFEESTEIPTIAVDGRKVYFNHHFVNALNNEELIFVLCAEVMRVALRLMTRCNKRDPKLWHAAGSYVVNGILSRERIGKFPDIGGLLDSRFDDLSTEEVYAILERERQQDNGGGQGGGGQGGGDGQGNNFDVGVSINESAGGDGTVTIDGDGNINIELNPDMMEDLNTEMISSMIEGAKNQMSRGVGSMPGEVSRMIGELSEPQVNWREFIYEAASGQVMTDYCRNKPSRRKPMAQYGIAFPSMQTEDHVEFSVAIDNSGSISQKVLTDFISELYGLASQFSSFEVNIWCFDTKVYNSQQFTNDNIDDLLDYQLMGGGGTCFRCVFDFMKETQHVPNQLVFLTDGHVYDWGDDEYCETVFIIHDQYAIDQKVKSPYGLTVYYDDQD